MGGGTRRRFVPGINGSFRLEGRLVLSAVGLAQPAGGLVAQAASQNVLTFRGTYMQATVNQLHAAYQAFITKYNRACQQATQGLAAGKNQTDLVNALKAYTQLEGGVLENQLNQVSRRLPGGVQFLYNLPTGAGPRDLYVPAALRLKPQADAMLAYLTRPTVVTVQDACSSAANTDMLQTYQSSRAAMAQYIRTSVTKGDFNVSGWTL
jgi:hypothetical protein